jgi:hypothetical protein
MPRWLRVELHRKVSVVLAMLYVLIACLAAGFINGQFIVSKIEKVK